MNILYGLSGEGFGHSSRARTVIPYLEEKGHEVKVMTYGKGVKALREDFDVFEIEGPEMLFEGGKLKRRKTIKKTAKNFISNLKSSREIHQFMKENDFDLCISDMSLLVPILANKVWYNKPLISLDNQHRLTHLEFEVPKKHKKDFLAAKEVTRAFVRRADWFIITSFGKSKIKEKYEDRTIVVPPIIRPKVKSLSPKEENKILVYSTKKNDKLLDTLKQIDQKFVVYGWDKEDEDENLIFHKTGDGFLEDLRKARAVIGSSGYTLISESLFLKKPYFALPLKGQFEQVLNSLFLEDSNLGDYSEDVDRDKIEEFLGEIDRYGEELKKYNPNYDKIFEALDRVLRDVEENGKTR